jgi:hypothetical protein
VTAGIFLPDWAWTSLMNATSWAQAAASSWAARLAWICFSVAAILEAGAEVLDRGQQVGGLGGWGEAAGRERGGRRVDVVLAGDVSPRENDVSGPVRCYGDVIEALTVNGKQFWQSVSDFTKATY